MIVDFSVLCLYNPSNISSEKKEWNYKLWNKTVTSFWVDLEMMTAQTEFDSSMVVFPDMIIDDKTQY